jgi:hypothetical protein
MNRTVELWYLEVQQPVIFSKIKENQNPLQKLIFNINTNIL